MPGTVMAKASWRPMTAADLPAVMAIAAAVHPAYPEDPAVFVERLRLAPAGCHVLASESSAPLAYLVSHPWPEGAVPALDTLLGALPEGETNWYLHDLALLPSARGTGAASAIVSMLVQQVRQAGYRSLALVAVNGSAGFWRRQGFAEVAEPALAAKLASYDGAACYMRRERI